MSNVIKIENCNCILEAKITIAEHTLNIKYGANGTGKSTISEALFAYANNKNERLEALRPYGTDDSIHPKVTNSNFYKLKVFDENYVNSYLFQGDEFFDDSFQVFLKSDECDQLAEQIEELLSELQSLIVGKPEIHNLRTFLPKYSEAVKASNGTISRRGGVADFTNGNGGGFEHYTELDGYKTFYNRELTTVSKWAKWRNEGSKQMHGDACPFCMETLPSNIGQQNAIISRVFKNSALSVANAVLEYLNQAVEQGYILEDAVKILESYIGDNAKGDELFAELQSLANETDYLDKKIEKICMFKPMNVSHEQLVNLERSLSELVIEKRQIQCFYATELIDGLIHDISEKINVLISKTGKLKGLFMKHEKKLDDLISRRENDINQFFTLAGFPYNFCLKKNGEKKAKAYLVPITLEGEIVKEPQKHLSWGEKNAFALVMFMFESISDNADLIVLDDPISAFDDKKKFAIIRRLFDNQKLSFREKTVLMLTHDLQPVIDYVHGSFFSRYGLTTPVTASLLQNINGVISESTITATDLKNTVELTKAIVESMDESMPVRIVNLRKYIEITKPNFGTTEIYDILSNLIHGRAVPLDKNKQELTAETIAIGMAEISEYIPGKSYDELLDELGTEKLIENLQSDAQYHRIISSRLLFERIDGALNLLRRKYPEACKFVNETNHIENDYIFQLDPRQYFSIPTYYLNQIEEFIQIDLKALLEKSKKQETE